jgi:hypothetical protein
VGRRTLLSESYGKHWFLGGLATWLIALLETQRRVSLGKGVKMPLQLGALRDALLNAGTQPELAEKAAEELAIHKVGSATLEIRLTILTWLLGFNVALTMLLVLWRVATRT